jgi:uncharacterized protein (DUF1684 family)
MGGASDAARVPDPDVATTLDVLDWRRRTHDLYRAVRDADDPATGHELWRQGRDDLFARHPASPLPPEHRAGFAGLAVAPYDDAYRLEAPIELADQGPDAFEATTGTDGVVPFRRLGRVRLTVPGGEVALDVWRLASYAGGLFLPLRDGTSGRASYGGGRYLLDTVKGADLGPGRVQGTVVVDLNFAYNPSCAYEPSWACPLAPPGNRTAVPLPVGEQHRGPWAV